MGRTPASFNQAGRWGVNRVSVLIDARRQIFVIYSRPDAGCTISRMEFFAGYVFGFLTAWLVAYLWLKKRHPEVLRRVNAYLLSIGRTEGILAGWPKTTTSPSRLP